MMAEARAREEARGVRNLETFVAEQQRLLGLEREAEIAEARLLQGEASLRSLCHAGLALQRLQVEGEATGLYGRTLVKVVPQLPALELPSHSLGPGDIVAVRGLPPSDSPPPSGVVTKATARSLTVAFEEVAEQLAPEDRGRGLGLVKLANDVTHRRLTTALSSLLAAPPSSLVSVLLGQAAPSTPHQTPPPACSTDGVREVLDQSLDASQREAADFCLLQREVGVVHGPPGTGKTTTLVEVVRQEVRAGGRVLVCAPSNVAVDNLLDRLHRMKVRVVRLGHPARASPELQPLSLDARIAGSEEGALVRDVYKELDSALKGGKKMRSEVKELRKELREREKKAIRQILSRAEVVLGTLTSCSPHGPLKHLPPDHMTLTVVDEASQALEAACWIVALTSKRLVLLLLTVLLSSPRCWAVTTFSSPPPSSRESQGWS